MLVKILMILGAGIVLRKIAQRFQVPQLLLYMLLGLTFHSYFNIEISGEIRRIALVIILLRAGLGMHLDDLKQVGKPSLLLSFVPGVLEGLAVMFIAASLLKIPLLEAGMLGFILAAVSPAVVVPAMLWLQEKKLGTSKNIPTMILAGASIDDVVAITIFSIFSSMYLGTYQNIVIQLLMIPVTIILGILAGYLVGKIVPFTQYWIVIPVALLVATLENYLPLASLLSVMVYGMVLRNSSKETAKLSNVLSQVWYFAEMLLFVLVGALIDPKTILASGYVGIVIVLGGLLLRYLGVFISLLGTNLNFKERVFVMISYTPKATVQAAMAGVPLALGVQSGGSILVIAVLAIFITTPIGAISMRLSAPKLLD